MAELIDKGALVELFEEKMFNSEAMCPIIKITDVLEVLEEQPTVTESEIRASVIDEFAEKLKAELSQQIFSDEEKFKYARKKARSNMRSECGLESGNKAC